MTVQDNTSGMSDEEAFFARIDASGPRVPPPPHSHAGWESLFAETEVTPGKPTGGDGADRAAACTGEAADSGGSLAHDSGTNDVAADAGVTDGDANDRDATDRATATDADAAVNAAGVPAPEPQAVPAPEPEAAAVPPSVVVSGPLRALVEAVSGVAGQDPTELPAE